MGTWGHGDMIFQNCEKALVLLLVRYICSLVLVETTCIMLYIYYLFKRENHPCVERRFVSIPTTKCAFIFRECDLKLGCSGMEIVATW